MEVGQVMPMYRTNPPHTDSDPDYTGTVDKDFSRSDTDWWELLDTDETIDDCSAWATIDGRDPFLVKSSYSSYSHVPF